MTAETEPQRATEKLKIVKFVNLWSLAELDDSNGEEKSMLVDGEPIIIFVPESDKWNPLVLVFEVKEVEK